WFIGGSFATINDLSRPCVAHLLSSGAVDANFNAGYLSGKVSALALSAGKLYVGGNFSNAAGNDLAAFDAATGAQLSLQAQGSSVHPGVTGLAAIGNIVYVSSGFTSIGGQTI